MKLLFSFIFCFFSYATDEQCLVCHNQVNDDYKLVHILDRHHQYSDSCYFCDYAPVRVTTSEGSVSATYGQHLKENHPNLFLGLYLYHFKDMPSKKRLSCWNKAYSVNSIIESPLITNFIKCEQCNKQVRAISTLFHFCHDLWSKNRQCSGCHHSLEPLKNKKHLSFDVLNAIKHARTCCFERFSDAYATRFPQLCLTNENNCLVVSFKTANNAQDSFNEPDPFNTPLKECMNTLQPSLIELYKCLLCNKLYSKTEEIFSHILDDVVSRTSIEKNKHECMFCPNLIPVQDYRSHLMLYHVPELYWCTSKITTESFFSMNNNSNT